MLDRRKMLRVKIKSLAEEARIIRREESRSKGGSQEQTELHLHRVKDVREEQRVSLLAYAFIRGRTLSETERRSTRDPDWKRVRNLVDKFGVVAWDDRKSQVDRLEQWRMVPAAV